MKQIFLFALVLLAGRTLLPAQTGAQLDVCAVYHCDGTPLADVHFVLNGINPAFPPFSYELPVTGASGCVNAGGFFIPTGSIVGLTATKDGDPLQWVNTFDLLRIQKHILGLQPLDSPYKMVAADANRSGSITTFDMVELQKLIVGIYDSLPNNTVWRFVDSSYVFPNPANPFQTGFQPIDTIQNYLAKKFYGVKIGDVDCQVFTSNLMEDLSMPNLSLQANDTVEVPVRLVQTESRVGLQFGLRYDPAKIEVLELVPEPGVLTGGLLNFGLLNDRVTTSWLSSFSPTTFPANKPLYRLRIKALAPVQLADEFSLDTVTLQGEVYLPNEQIIKLRLQFSAVVATNEPEVAAQIFAPQPNPTTAGLHFPLFLEKTASVTLEISDALGHLIYQQKQAGLSGAQSLEVPATALPQAGIYFWRVQAGTTVRLGKVVKQ